MEGSAILSRPSRPAAREAVAGAVRNLLDGDEGAAVSGGQNWRPSPAMERARLSGGAGTGSRGGIPRSASYSALIGQPEALPQHSKHGRTAARQRPTNNALLYKANFRWSHYTQRLTESDDEAMPEHTTACPSVTTAFLQVLLILFNTERRRASGARNILAELSTNTRRTKVVELSSGTHRVPEELKRQSLTDNSGGQYSTNLDRNRYGEDNQYLATVIRYNLDFLGLCPCLVGVDILDAKTGGTSKSVKAGLGSCTCSKRRHSEAEEEEEEHGQEEEDEAQISDDMAPGKGYESAGARSGSLPPLAPKHALASTPAEAAETLSGATTKNTYPRAANGGASGAQLPPAGGGMKHSRSLNSDKFDALLMAATGGTEAPSKAVSADEAQVTSPHSKDREGREAAAAGTQQRERAAGTWAAGDGDSLVNALDAFAGNDAEAASSQQTSSRLRSRKRQHHSSLTSLLALSLANNAGQAGAAEGVARGPRPAGGATAAAAAAALAKSAPAGDAGLTDSVQSHEDDTEAHQQVASDKGPQRGAAARVGGEEEEEEVQGELEVPLRRGPTRASSRGHVPLAAQRQLSAADLANVGRAGRDGELRRLQTEVRRLQEGQVRVEGQIEEAASRERQATALVTQLQSKLKAQDKRHCNEMKLQQDRTAAAEGARQDAEKALAARQVELNRLMSSALSGGSSGKTANGSAVEMALRQQLQEAMLALQHMAASHQAMLHHCLAAGLQFQQQPGQPQQMPAHPPSSQGGAMKGQVPGMDGVNIPPEALMQFSAMLPGLLGGFAMPPQQQQHLHQQHQHQQHQQLQLQAPPVHAGHAPAAAQLQPSPMPATPPDKGATDAASTPPLDQPAQAPLLVEAQQCLRPRTASQMAEPVARRPSESPPHNVNAPASPGAPHPHKHPPSSHSPLTNDATMTALLQGTDKADPIADGNELPPRAKRMRMAEQLPSQLPGQLPGQLPASAAMEAGAVQQAIWPQQQQLPAAARGMHEKQPEVSPNAASNRSDRDILMLSCSNGVVLPGGAV